MNRKVRRHRRGFTLIEMIIVLVIIAVVVPTVMVGLNTLVIQSNRAEKITVATDLARYYIELALSKRFDEVIPGPLVFEPVNWTDPGSLGPEGEAGIDNFDDVDDFDGFAQNPIIFSDGMTFDGYSLAMTVQYWTDTGGGGQVGIWDTTPSAVETNAKHIRVVVNHSLIGDVTLDCVTGALY